MSASGELLRYFIAFLLALGCVVGSTKLLLAKKIKQTAFCFLILASLFVGLWVGYSDRVKEFTLSVGKMSVVLAEMRDTQRDVQEREEKIRRVAALMGDLVSYIQGTSIGIEGSKAREEWLQIKLKALSSVSGQKLETPFSRLSQRLSTRNPDDEEQLQLIWKEFEKDIEAEVAKLKSQ